MSRAAFNWQRERGLKLAVLNQGGTSACTGFALSNVINFLPLAHRTRFEKREMVIDPNTGTERSQVVAVADRKMDGLGGILGEVSNP